MTAVLRRWLAVAFLLAAGCGAWLPTAFAQGCYPGGFGVSFGSMAQGATSEVIAAVPYACQSNYQTTYYKVCLFIPEGPSGTNNDQSGVNPRRMTDYNGNTVYYTLYSDPARTQVIGPFSSGYPMYEVEFSVPPAWQQPAKTLNVYGRAGPVAAGTPAGNYQAQIGGITMHYTWSNSGPPASCLGGTIVGVGFSGATASVVNGCQMSITSLTNMIFGATGSLAAAIDSTSTITMACPVNTSWRVGLSDGANALGTQRRMAGPVAGEYVQYELYRDPARTQRWGNDAAGGTDTVNGSGTSHGNPANLTVYGRVPAQAAVSPGNYVDTVTVTVTY